MSDPGRFPTHHVPDDGRTYEVGQRVRVDRAPDTVDVVPDPDGDYEVHSWRQATELEEGDPLLRVDLRRIEA
jgi:hypothetical protein